MPAGRPGIETLGGDVRLTRQPSLVLTAVPNDLVDGVLADLAAFVLPLDRHALSRLSMR